MKLAREIRKVTLAMKTDTFVEYGYKAPPVTPESLGLPPLEIKSMGKAVYYPRFACPKDKNVLVIQFGHYFGGGAYHVDTLLGRDGFGGNSIERGLMLYGSDNSGNSSIHPDEMKKLYHYLVKYEKVLEKEVCK